MFMCACVCVYMCLDAHNMCTRRIDQNVPARSLVAGTVPVESQQPALKNDHYYSTVAYSQQQMFGISDYPTYDIVPEHNQKPMQEDDRAYSNIDISQQEEVVTSGKLGYAGSAPGAAARYK